jgi:antitoxin VapB
LAFPIAILDARGVEPVARTRVFKSGNGLAIRIPADIVYDDMNIELEVIRSGDVITIFPARQSLKEMVAELRRLPKPDGVELLERTEVPERERD